MACGKAEPGKAWHMYESVLEGRARNHHTYAMWTAIKGAICAINEPNKRRKQEQKGERQKKESTLANFNKKIEQTRASLCLGA